MSITQEPQISVIKDVALFALTPWKYSINGDVVQAARAYRTLSEPHYTCTNDRHRCLNLFVCCGEIQFNDLQFFLPGWSTCPVSFSPGDVLLFDGSVNRKFATQQVEGMESMLFRYAVQGTVLV